MALIRITSEKTCTGGLNEKDTIKDFAIVSVWKKNTVYSSHKWTVVRFSENYNHEKEHDDVIS